MYRKEFYKASKIAGRKLRCYPIPFLPRATITSESVIPSPNVSTTANVRCLSIYSRCNNPFTAKCASITKQLDFAGRKTRVNYSRNTLDPSMEEYLLSLNLLDGGNEEANKRLNLLMIKNLETVYGKGKVNQSHLDFFGKEGLRALATSIIREEGPMDKPPAVEDTTSSVITVRFKVPHHNTEFDIPWHYKKVNSDGQQSTLLDLRNDTTEGSSLLSEYIEASCGGNCSCSSCHVYIDTSVIVNTDPTQPVELSNVTDAEQDMLDLAYQPNEQSRLACQVRLLKLPPSVGSSNRPILNVTLPSGVNDMWK